MPDRQKAKNKLRQIFKSGRILDVQINPRQEHKNGAWEAPLNTGWYGIPDGNKKYVVAPATVNIDGFLKLQYNAINSRNSYQAWLSGAYDPTVQRAIESIELGTDKIPKPVIELKTTGKVPQEGRSRAVGAKKAGLKRMPVWIAIQVYK